MLTLSQMAKRLGCSSKIFSKDVRDKQIPYRPVGKRKKFDPDEVLAYLKTHDGKLQAPVARPRLKERGRFAERLGL